MLGGTDRLTTDDDLRTDRRGFRLDAGIR